ncbi:MAG: protein kinase [Actinomycetota bacterium]|nr:protein kinase [Actinomycetota bacterium]
MLNEVIAGRYEIRELVGTGGMSAVYLAHDRLLERKVALKILHGELAEDQDYVERFRREARAVAQLSHPNIVTVIDRLEQDGRQLIVFEYVEGENLKDLVEREGPLPVRGAIEITLQVGGGLAFAHGHGLVHRDVKPHNVLLDGGGRAKVTDFGIARSLDVDDAATTGAGRIAGTSHYIAPEQAHGKEVSEQTDVYSLGAVLYEVLTGDVPFPGENFVSVAMRHVNDPVPSVRETRPDVSERLDAAVARAMAKDPAERFDSMEAFCAELDACLDELHAEGGETAIIGPADPRFTPAPAGPRRRRWPLVAIPFLLLAAAGAGFLAYSLLGGGDGKGNGPPSPRPVREVALQGVTAYDPEGTGGTGEHDKAAPLATDGNPETYWSTEHYNAFQKQGVGLVVGAKRAVSLTKLTVNSTTPGFTAEIRAGGRESGPFRKVSGSQRVGDRTTFQVKTKPHQYYVIWITDLGGAPSVAINEVTAFGRA